MSFDEGVLDEPARLEQRDAGRLLWSLATAGAQVRRAVETVGDFGVDRLRGDDPPRSLLVATDDPTAGLLVARHSCARTPPVVWRGVELPRWAGPADALLVASADGRSPGLATLAAQGAQRGMVLAVVAPTASQVATAAAGRAPTHELTRDLHPRAARWAVLVPLLQALDALGVALVPASLLIEIADALDEQAEMCRPNGDAFTNPAKAMAAEFADATPLIAGAGALAGVAADTVACAIELFAGTPAVPVSLPEGMERAAALLRGAGVDDTADFFRDRIEDDDVAVRRPRLLVIGDDGAPDDPLLGERTELAIALDEVAARQAARALTDLAAGLGVRSSSVEVPGGDPLARFAAATAFGDFTAAYLALGLGLDPSGAS